jgi:hypothetical protein
MFWLIDLHADIMVFLIFIVGLVLALIYGIITPFFRTSTPEHRLTVPNNNYVPLEFVDLRLYNHNSFYEMI